MVIITAIQQLLTADLAGVANAMHPSSRSQRFASGKCAHGYMDPTAGGRTRSSAWMARTATSH